MESDPISHFGKNSNKQPALNTDKVSSAMDLTPASAPAADASQTTDDEQQRKAKLATSGFAAAAQAGGRGRGRVPRRPGKRAVGD